MGTTIWSLLASGLLSGKYLHGVPHGSRLAQSNYAWLRDSLLGQGDPMVKVRALVPIAEKLEASLAQLSLAWCLKNPRVSTVILGASKREQLEENFKALEVAEKLDADVMEAISAAVAGP